MVFAVLLPSQVRAQVNTQVTCDGTTNEVTFTNQGQSPETVTFVTAVFRGFQPDPTVTTCPDTEYWERRFPSVMDQNGKEELAGFDLAAGTSTMKPLSEFLPEAFSPGSLDASACDHYILSLEVISTDAGNKVTQVVSCKQGTFAETLVTPSGLESGRVAQDLKFAPSIMPKMNSTAVAGACYNQTDLSQTLIQNRSSDLVYQGIYGGRWVCKKSNTPGVSDTSVFNTPVPQNQTPSATTGRAMRGTARGFRLDPDQCAGVRVGPGGGFPTDCDCADSCAGKAPVVLQCGRGVITGEKTVGGTWTIYEPFIFLNSHFDLQPDKNSSITRDNVALKCAGYAFSDIAGFQDPNNVVSQFNSARFKFDFDSSSSVENIYCNTRVAVVPPATGVSDFDQNGLGDACQQVFPLRQDFSGGNPTTIRNRARNLIYEGSPSDTSSAPSLGAHPEIDFGGQIKNLQGTDTTLVTDTIYVETLTFPPPAGLAVPADALSMTLSPNGTPALVREKFHGADWLFGGVEDSGLGTSRLLGADLVETAERDLVLDQDGKMAPVLDAAPLETLAASPDGHRVYAGAGHKLYKYESNCLQRPDLSVSTCAGAGCPVCSADPEVGLDLGWDVFAVSSEPQDQYVYVMTKSNPIVSTENRTGLSVLDVATNQVSASFIETTSGSACDLQVVDPAGSTTPKAIAYVTKVDIAQTACSGGGTALFQEVPDGPGRREVSPVPLLASLDPAPLVFDLLSGLTPVRPLLQVILPCGPGHEGDPGCGSGGAGGGGGGGGSTSRHISLVAWDLDRENNFAFPSQLNQIEVSCVDQANAPILRDVGVDIASDGRVFMVSPDTKSLLVFSTATSGSMVGQIDAASKISIPLGWSPTDVVVGLGPEDPTTRIRSEMAVVVGTDHLNELGEVNLFKDLAGFANPTPLTFAGTMSWPVSVVLRDNGTSAYVALQGKGEVRRIDLTTQPEAVDPVPVVVTSGSLTRLAIQRHDP